MRYDVVVFDLGGVLVRWDPAAAVTGITDAAGWQRAARDLDFAALNHQADAGRPYAELLEHVAARHAQRPDLVALYRHYLQHVGDSFPGEVPGTSAVAEDLLERGVRVLGLTNWSAQTVHHSLRAAPVIARFEALVVSGREGVTKPDARIFDLLLERHDIDPASALFVDDSAPNVQAARARGMAGHLFTDAASLRAQLRPTLGTGPRR